MLKMIISNIDYQRSNVDWLKELKAFPVFITSIPESGCPQEAGMNKLQDIMAFGPLGSIFTRIMEINDLSKVVDKLVTCFLPKLQYFCQGIQWCTVPSHQGSEQP